MVGKQFLLPLWRQGEVVIFTAEESRYKQLLDWIAVAVAPDVEPYEFTPTGRMRLTAEDLERCTLATQSYAIWLGRDHGLADADMLAQRATDRGALLETCAYLHLLRKYAVDLSIIAAYEASDRQGGFSFVEATAINKILSNYMLRDRAAAILPRDIALARQQSAPASDAAEYFRTAAICAEMGGDLEAAETSLAEAIRFNKTEDKLRKLGDIQFQRGDLAAAATSFLAAETIKELPIPAAFRLGKLLVELARGAEARPYLERAQEAFPGPVERMLKRIDAGQNTGSAAAAG